MKPLFFGDPSAPLFGAYHPPAAKVQTGVGVVICPPVGHEYFKAHRALWLLGAQLARVGTHVWLFDYHGTGDSAGGGDEGDLEVWLDDIALAIRELRAVARPTRLSLVGLRFGASLAAGAAARDQGVASLVLCDPIPRGPTYLEEMMSLVKATDDGSATLQDSKPISVEGYQLTGRLRDQIAAMDLIETLDSYSGEVLAVFTDGTAADRMKAAAGDRRFAAWEVLPDPRRWASPNQEPIVPHPALRWITERLKGKP